ncbi:hypothetical protein Tsubulata_040396 [Turnera subulata]|uniref:Uncharacterized protein n=1 Tax=Turnera subulata TaxID=218843 RepID=A0A9Q0F1C5_9ROSI|nr:hypothetical protein Tsubulata_040396 [Turnera subulata]
MALILSRPKHRSLTNPSLFHLFSTSSFSTPPSNEQPKPRTNPDSPPQSSIACSYNGGAKASIKRQIPNNPQAQNHQGAQNFQSFRRPTRINTNPPRRVASLVEIRKSLRSFRRTAAASPSPAEPYSTTSSSPQGQQPQNFSFQEVYTRSVIARQDAAGRDPSGGRPGLGNPSADLDASWAILGRMNRNPKFEEMKVRLRSAVFRREMMECERSDGKSEASTDFVRMHSHEKEELGKEIDTISELAYKPRKSLANMERKGEAAWIDHAFAGAYICCLGPLFFSGLLD